MEAASGITHLLVSTFVHVHTFQLIRTPSISSGFAFAIFLTCFFRFLFYNFFFNSFLLTMKIIIKKKVQNGVVLIT